MFFLQLIHIGMHHSRILRCKVARADTAIRGNLLQAACRNNIFSRLAGTHGNSRCGIGINSRTASSRLSYIDFNLVPQTQFDRICRRVVTLITDVLFIVAPASLCIVNFNGGIRSREVIMRMTITVFYRQFAVLQIKSHNTEQTGVPTT